MSLRAPGLCPVKVMLVNPETGAYECATLVAKHHSYCVYQFQNGRRLLVPETLATSLPPCRS